MVKEKFYVTTTIPYANAPPHIGFALEIVQADILARWNRLLSKDVFFLTGTDEHGQKNYTTAKNKGIDVKDFVDSNTEAFLKLTKELKITNDNFIRTTDKDIHWPGVEKLWKILVKNGDLEKKKYTGFYCTGCERFITEKELEDGKCPDHPTLDIQEISEENYFFKLSKYSDKIKKLIESDELKIRPIKWKNDFLSLIKDGLTDVSFSRDKNHLPWGIPVPNDPSQVMYVWCDALTNYLTGIGYPDKKYEKYWPADVHVVGKDMLRFHTGIFPGMLLSAGFTLPKEFIVHGFLTVDGKKMSKSVGNVVSPLDLLKKYDSDSIRYLLARAIPFGDDGDFSEDALISRHNDELANKLGNLVSRVTGLIEKNGMEVCENKLGKKFKIKEISKLMNEYKFDKALNDIFAFIDRCNEYIQEKKPWETKDLKVLYEVADSIKKIAIVLSPFIPESSEKIAKQFGFKIAWEELEKPFEIFEIKKSKVLFEKVEVVNIASSVSTSANTKAPSKNLKSGSKSGSKLNKESVVKEIMEGVGSVEFSDWEKLDLRVAEVENVEAIEGADKLWKLSLDVGELGKRIICAGLKEFYSDEELKGKKIIYFSNLKPRKMRGVESQGMLLAASNKDHSKVQLIAPIGEIENGSIVG